MFEFKGVKKQIQTDFWKSPKIILDDLSFNVTEGSLCGFLGANGAGKTTSIRSFFKFIAIDGGEISYSPELGKNWNEIKSNIGFFPERPYFYSSMTGREFCRYIFNLSPRGDFNSSLNFWSERINIDYALDQKIRGYSKGMLQRLGFLTTIINNPKLIILDEPLSGLDPIGRAEFKSVLKELNQKGITIFFSSHVISDVEEICSDIILIENGRCTINKKMIEVLSMSGDSRFHIKIRKTSELPKELACVMNYEANEDVYVANVNEEEKNRIMEQVKKNPLELVELKRDLRSLEQIVYKRD